MEQVLERLAAYPGVNPQAIAEVEVFDVLRQGGESFTPTEWLAVGRAVSRCAADDRFAGVIVTHGTFTAEETAFFLHLSVGSEKPVVVACSQRKHTTIGNDGDHNLLDALRVAAAPEAWGKGVLLVLNEEIHSAREVIKTNQRPSGFTSRTQGILGSVESDQVTFYRAPTRRHTARSEFVGAAELDRLPRVDIVATYAGADGTAVRAFVEAGAQGIVVNGFAFTGRPHHLQEPELGRALERGVPVVLVNRGGDGRVPVDANAHPGFVRGDNLPAQKARILLALGLTRTRDPGELQRMFNEY